MQCGPSGDPERQSQDLGEEKEVISMGLMANHEYAFHHRQLLGVDRSAERLETR